MAVFSVPTSPLQPGMRVTQLPAFPLVLCQPPFTEAEHSLLEALCQEVTKSG